MRYINKYLRNLSPYKVASHKVWEVDSEQRNMMLKLDWNEATIPPAPGVKKAIQSLAGDESMYFLYPSTHNNELVSSLAKYAEVAEENVQYFASSDSLHEYLVRMFVMVGDPILILGPTYDNFRLTCEAQGANVLYYEYEKDFTLNYDSLVKSIEELSPSLVYLCNPNNPSGNVLHKEYIVTLLDNFSDTVFVIDEAYYEFYGESMANYVIAYQNLFVTRTFSKAFALANFRAGYLISHANNINQINKIRNPKNISTFTQTAIIEVLKDIDYMQKFVEEVKLAREEFSVFLESQDFIKAVYPSQGNFILVELTDFDLKVKLFKYLADQNIFVRNLLHSKHLLNTLRITIGTREQMKLVMSVIEKFGMVK
ncbi:histidinol-phosphate transaminase [Bacteroidota bacterium]